MFYTESAIRSAKRRIENNGVESSLAWAIDTIESPVASANCRAVAHAVYDLLTDHKLAA